METPSPVRVSDERVSRRWVAAEVGLALLAAVLLGAAVNDAARNEAIMMSARVELAVAGCVAVVAALAAAGVARRSQRWTAWLLALGLLSALVYHYLDESQPATAVPLLVALLLVLKPLIEREREPGVDHSTSHTVVSVVSVALMVPIGLVYLVAAMLLQPVVYAVGLLLYMALLGWTIWQARRWSYSAAAGPVLAVTYLYAGALASEHLGWVV